MDHAIEEALMQRDCQPSCARVAWACLLAACTVFGEGAVRADGGPAAKRTHQLILAPGEGTVLCLGTAADFDAVKAKYLAPGFRPEGNRGPSKPGDPYRLDFMPFGFYVADHTSPGAKAAAERMGLDLWTYLDRLLRMMKDAGANTLFIQGGGYVGKESEPNSIKRFARFARERGLHVIVQPENLFFRGPGYFQPGTYFHKNWKDAPNFYQTYLVPQMRASLPHFKDDKDIFAWAPTEELDPDGEELYAAYKKLLRELNPDKLIYQLDSQQADEKRLRSKKPPYPDLYALDRYCWWESPLDQPYGPNLYLWTPHFATRWLHGVFKEYADAVHKLYKGQAIGTILGLGMVYCFDWETGRKYGWKEEAGFVPPTLPQYRWNAEAKAWVGWGWYFPPPNAERLASWLTICAGMKGVLVWGALVDSTPAEAQALLAGKGAKPGAAVNSGILRYDLTKLPQADEFGRAWREIGRFSNVLLSIEPAPVVYAEAADPYLFVNSFTDKAGRRYVIVVNGQIGQWDGHSPDWLNYPKTKLTVGPDGNLVNYTPLTERRKCSIKINGDWQVFDLRL
jgi:hypothetical protein